MTRFFAKRLLPAALELLSKVGRWVLHRISRRGRKSVMNYMQGRIDVFRDRLNRARTDLRRSFLERRIHRWQLVVAWLSKHWAALTRKVADRLDRELHGRVNRYVEQTT